MLIGNGYRKIEEEREEKEFKEQLNEMFAKYTRAEYNERLLTEIKKGELTSELRLLFYYLAIDVLFQKRYNGMTG